MSDKKVKSLNVDKRSDDDVIFINKRKHTRIEAELEVTLNGPHNFFTGFTQNISEGGVFIATHQVFPIGTEFELTLKIGDKVIHPTAKVVWVREPSPFLPDDIDPGMGLQFVNLTEEEKRIIEEFIKKKEPMFFDAD